MIETYIPENLFDFYQRQRFLYDFRNKPEIIEKMRADLTESLGDRLKREVQIVMYYLGVLLEGDFNNPRYNKAYERYSDNLKGINPMDYHDFLCETFNVKPANVKISKFIPRISSLDAVLGNTGNF